MTVIMWTIGIAVIVVAVALAGLAIFSAWTTRQIEKLLPPRGHFIDVDGARIHYLDEGTGPPLLLIHGLSGQTGHYTHSLLDLLKNDYRVVILDRPGSGYSTRPSHASAAIADQADTISRFIDALGLHRPLVVGHSLGGAIALSLAVDHPEQVAGLALIAPATHLPEKAPNIFRGLAIRSPFMRALVAWTFAIPTSIRNRDLVLEIAFGPQAAPRDYGIKGGGLMSLRPSNFIAASRDLMATHDQRDDDLTEHYGSIKVPVGVLYGAGDRILDPTAHCAALIGKLAGAEIELIEGGGHMILICSADRCAEFIDRIAKRAAAGATQTETELA